jgi:NAD(P)-dependent dehydrogenase (short-subunit alcohol dehydrogenase family)
VSYSVIKAGLVGLTRFLATYWADAKIRVNSLSPGGVYENQDAIFVENLVSRIPMSRMAKLDEYVGAIQFLCSDASEYMTGQNIVIDGGRTIW